MSTGATFQEHSLAPHALGAMYRFRQDHPTPRHFHGQLEFMVVVAGRAVEQVGNKAYSLNPRQLVWHLPGVEHRLLEISPDLDMRVVHFEPDVAGAVAANRMPQEQGEPPAPGVDSFAGWAKQLSTLVSGRPVVNLTTLEHQALLEDCEPVIASGSSPSPEVARRLLINAGRATQANYDYRRSQSCAELASCLLLEDPSLSRAELCRRLSVSEGYLSRRFQAEFGLSFLEHRARIRVSRFVTHVSRERRSLTEAASMAGFGSYSQLHRVFTKVVGKGPREYLIQGGRAARAALLGEHYRTV